MSPMSSPTPVHLPGFYGERKPESGAESLSSHDSPLLLAGTLFQDNNLSQPAPYSAQSAPFLPNFPLQDTYPSLDPLSFNSHLSSPLMSNIDSSIGRDDRLSPHPRHIHAPYPQPQALPPAIRSQSGESMYTFVTRRSHNKKALTPHEKKNICLYAERYPSMRQEDIASIFHVERSTVSKILKDSSMWLNAPHYPSNTKNYKARRAKYPGLEDAMIPWLQECRDKNITITDNAIKEKAAEINKDINAAGPDFKASGGWLENFKRRQGIKGGQYRGTHATVVNGIAHEEQVQPLAQHVETGYKHAYRGYDLHLATGKYLPPDPEFWEPEHDDPGLDTSMDSDDALSPVNHPSTPVGGLSPSATGPHSLPGHRSYKASRDSISPSPLPQHLVGPARPPSSASSSSNGHRLEPPHVAPIPTATPWHDQAAGEAHMASNPYTSLHEKPDQAPLIFDPGLLTLDRDSPSMMPLPAIWESDRNMPFSGAQGRAHKAPISTLEAREQLANICMYLDAHGRSRKLCKRSQRLAIQDVLANVLKYMDGREMEGLEPN